MTSIPTFAIRPTFLGGERVGVVGDRSRDPLDAFGLVEIVA